MEGLPLAAAAGPASSPPVHLSADMAPASAPSIQNGWAKIVSDGEVGPPLMQVDMAGAKEGSVGTVNLKLFADRKDLGDTIHPCITKQNSQLPVEFRNGSSGSAMSICEKVTYLESDAVPTLNNCQAVAAEPPCTCPTDDNRKKEQNLQIVADENHEEQSRRHAGLAPNVHKMSAAECIPFYSNKKLVQTKIRDASECGSTSGPAEESDSLKLWRQMKQNGFLSKPCEAVGIPKPCSLPSKKAVAQELNKNPASDQRHSLMHTLPPDLRVVNSTQEKPKISMKTAPPSGLLSGLNPGIITKVRNSKQVYSIIQAICSEKQQDQDCQAFTCQNGERARDGEKTGVEFLCTDNSTGFHSPEAARLPPYSQKYNGMSLHFSSCEATTSERAAITSHSDVSLNQNYMAAVSIKAATVASQWLQLLHQDFRGRLAALRRSKKRVRNFMEAEFPLTLPDDHLEADLLLEDSDRVKRTRKQLGSWMSLFSQMDRALNEEERDLENRVRQVQEMQMSCDKGLNFFNPYASQQDSLLEASKASAGAPESECAVKAAAASIYSTCNLAMQNVQCF